MFWIILACRSCLDNVIYDILLFHRICVYYFIHFHQIWDSLKSNFTRSKGHKNLTFSCSNLENFSSSVAFSGAEKPLDCEFLTRSPRRGYWGSQSLKI